MLIKLLLKILKSKKISSEERGLILNTLVSGINAFPITDVISYDIAGTLQVNDKPLTMEQAKSIKEGANSLLNNNTYRVIKEQIAYNAIKMGIHKSLTVDMLLLSKAALWVQQQEIELIKTLSGSQEEVLE